MRVFLVIIVVVLLAAAGALVWLTGDANRFKPQIEAELSRLAERDVKLNGDLSWQLFPPVTLSAKDVVASDDESVITVGELQADIDALSLLNPPEEWRINNVTILNGTQTEDGTELVVRRAEIDDFRFGQSTPVAAQGRYTSGDVTYPFTVRGDVIYDREQDTLDLKSRELSVAGTSANCDIKVTGLARDSLEPFSKDELIPTDTYRQYDWVGQCLVPSLALADKTFEAVAIDLNNERGRASHKVIVPDVFGGSAELDIDVDARNKAVSWVINPTLTEVDSVKLMAWLEQSFKWAAPLAFSGELRGRGNTSDALLRSLNGTTRFDGGQGDISIATIREQLIKVTSLAGDSAKIQNWPEMLGYQVFNGEWTLNGTKSALNFQLDNLKATATGLFDPVTEEIDLAVELTFEQIEELNSFDVNDYLVNVPIPVRCKGTTNQPKCRIDSAGVSRLIGRVLSGDVNDPLREKLEETIDKEVPEEYRGAAKALLDMLGGSLDQERRPQGTTPKPETSGEPTQPEPEEI